MGDNKDDPFGSLTELCHVSSSQEERLRHCPFARESDECSEDNPPDSGELNVASTGIVMMSLPDSSESKDDSTPHDVFQTPPEGSVFASSEEQRSLAADDLDDRTVGGAGDDTVAVDGGFTHGANAVDLGKDSDLGFSEVELTQRINIDSEENSSLREVIESESKKLGSLRRELSLKEGLAESPSKKPKLSEQNLGLEDSAACARVQCEKNTENFEKLDSESHQNLEISEEMAVEMNGSDEKPEEKMAKRKLDFSNGDTESIRLESEESSEEDLEEAEVGVEYGRGYSKEMIIETIEKLQRVSPRKLLEIANASERYRVLPVSMREENGTEGVEDYGVLYPEGGKEVTILDVLKILKEEGDEEEDDSLKDISIFELCKQRGMTFPRPRWWPEEGFEVVGNDNGGGDVEKQGKEEK